jgi:hypothetical protein
MRRKAVWPSTASFFAPAEVAASLALVLLVAGFAGILLLHSAAAHPRAGDASTASVRTTPVVPSPTPEPSPSPQATPPSQPAGPVTQPVNPGTGANRADAATVTTSRPRVFPTGTPTPILPSPLATDVPPILPSPLAPTPTP